MHDLKTASGNQLGHSEECWTLGEGIVSLSA